MDFEYSPTCERFRSQVQQFMDDHILPRAAKAKREHHEGKYPLSFMEERTSATTSSTGESGSSPTSTAATAA